MQRQRESRSNGCKEVFGDPLKKYIEAAKARERLIG